MTRTVDDPERLLSLGIIDRAGKDRENPRHLVEVAAFYASDWCQELCLVAGIDYGDLLIVVDHEDQLRAADWREVREMRFAAERGVG